MNSANEKGCCNCSLKSIIYWYRDSSFPETCLIFHYQSLKGAETADGNTIAAVKHKMHANGLSTMRTPNFVQKVQKKINKNPRKSIRAITKDLKMSECTIRRKLRMMTFGTSHVIRRSSCWKYTRVLFDLCEVLAKQTKTPRNLNVLVFVWLEKLIRIKT